MNGNGKPGAKTRLALLEGDVKNIKDNFSKMTNWIVGAAITLMTGGFLWILNQLAILMQKAK
jgi:ABC-type siderophore export system fused ATPase/permease subunit